MNNHGFARVKTSLFKNIECTQELNCIIYKQSSALGKASFNYL